MTHPTKNDVTLRWSSPPYEEESHPATKNDPPYEEQSHPTENSLNHPTKN